MPRFLAAFLLIYSAIADRVERSLISGPILFTAVGLILGPYGLGVVRIEISGDGLRLLAELTLAMALFTDAANADFGIVRRNLGLPERLLLIGLPLTIVLGFLLAAIIFPSLSTLEMALLATMLAPTDAALGKPVVTNRAAERRRPWRDRQPDGEEDGRALGRARRLDGRPCHRLRGSRPSLGAAPSDADTPHSHFAATCRLCLARPQPIRSGPDRKPPQNPEDGEGCIRFQ
jgi:hypothetical protein